MSEIKGFKVVPVTVPERANMAANVHQMFIKPHTTHEIGIDETRSLFVFNTPPLANLEGMRKLFKQVHASAIIEGFYQRENYNPTGSPDWDTFISLSKLSNKEFGQDLPREGKLPVGTCVVEFIDKDSLELVISVLTKKKLPKLQWEPISVTGIQRYNGSSKVCDDETLEEEVAQSLVEFQERENEALEEVDQLRDLVDEDGFTLVVGKQSKTKSEVLGVSKSIDDLHNADELKEKSAAKHKMDFYRFQVRERKKQEMSELLAKFKDDQEKVKIMKQKRKFRPY